MKKLHATDLSDGEFTAVFRAAAKQAVDRALVNELPVPSHRWIVEDKTPSAAIAEAQRMSTKPRKKAVA
jgi:hypothetical protein